MAGAAMTKAAKQMHGGDPRQAPQSERSDRPGSRGLFRRRGGRDGYDAFISYSHAGDGELAPALQTGVEKFAKPWYRSRALRVFRDQTSLSADPGLWSAIEIALARSSWFVLMASPKAAASPWVDRELRWWLEHRSVKRLLIVVTSGALDWDQAAGDFDPAGSTALPAALQGAFDEEPRWVDCPWSDSSEQVSRVNPDLQQVVADVAATIRGVAKDELVGVHVREHKRTMRLASAAVTALVTLLVVAVAAAIVAITQRNTAREQTRIATSRQLAVESRSNLNGRPGLAYLQALEAVRTSATPEARGALLSAIQQDPRRVAILPSPGGAQSVASSPDGRLLAVGGGTGVVFWDATRRTRAGPPLSIVGADRTVLSVAFSPDGSAIAVADYAGLIEFFDVGSRRSLGAPVLAHEGRSRAFRTTVAFSGDGRTLASAGESQVTLVDVARRRPVARLPGDSEDVAFSPDGRTLAVSGMEGVTLWSLGGQPRVLERRAAQGVRSIAWSPVGNTLAVGSDDGTVRLWNRNLRVLGTPVVKIPGWVQDIAFSPYGHRLAAGDARQLRLWDLDRHRRIGAPLVLTSQAEGTYQRLAFTRDGRMLASLTAGGDVVLWEPSQERPPLATSVALDERAGGGVCAISRDGNRVAAVGRVHGAEPPTVTVFDAHARSLGSFVGGDTTGIGSPCAAFNADGRMLALPNGDSLVLWDLDDRQQRSLTVASSGSGISGRLGGVVGTAFSPDGRTLALGLGDGTVVLWDIEKNQQVGPSFGREGAPATQLVFSQDGRFLAAGGFVGAGNDGRVELVDVRARRSAATFPHARPSAVAFRPDGRLLASGGFDGEVILWDVERRQRRLAPFSAHDGTIHSLAFGPDGHTLVSVGEDAKVILWDVSAEQPVRIATLSDHAAASQVAVISPDGRMLVHDQGTRLVRWDLELGSWRRQACSVVRPLLEEGAGAFFNGQQERSGAYKDVCDGLDR